LVRVVCAGRVSVLSAQGPIRVFFRRDADLMPCRRGACTEAPSLTKKVCIEDYFCRSKFSVVWSTLSSSSTVDVDPPVGPRGPGDKVVLAGTPEQGGLGGLGALRRKVDATFSRPDCRAGSWC
jgi:hypothetical protein